MKKNQLINKNGEVVRLIDDNEVVPEGHGIRVSAFLMDGAPSYLTDAYGNPAGHRPGYIFNNDTRTQDEGDAALVAYKARIRDAWKTPVPSAVAVVADEKTARAAISIADAEAAYEARKAELPMLAHDRGRAMRSTNLPQTVAVRLLDLDERVTDLISKADKADAAVERARAIIGNKVEVGPEEFNKVRDGFPAIYAEAQAARQRADSERGILNGIRSWVANLPHETRLVAVPTPADQDLGKLETKLQTMRAELGKLQHVVVPADDIAAKVTAYVHTLAAKAQPLLRGYGPGQQLDVRWPGGPDTNPLNGNGYSNIDGNGLMLAALLHPTALAAAIMHAVEATQPMPRKELEKRRAELPNQIDELSYTVAALRDKAGLPPDQNMSPWHYLGVRTEALAISA